MSDEAKPIIQDEVLMQENRNLQILQRSLAGALKEVFGEYSESQRFLDLKRIPLICKDISNINTSLTDIKGSIGTKENDHETRLRTLETFMNTLMGKITMVSIFSSIMVSFIMSLVFIFIQHYWK